MNKETVDDSMPVPQEELLVDPEKVEKWIESEGDEEVRAIKRKIVEHIEHVDFETFRGDLEAVVRGAVTVLAESNESYALFFDYKPHSSKRWVYELSKMGYAPHPPSEARHFTPAWEKMSQYEKLRATILRGVNTFMVCDDAAYSGEQILNRQIDPILKFYEQEGLTQRPKFVIAVPYITTRFLQLIEQIKSSRDCDLEIFYQKIMPTLSETLTDAEKDTLMTKRAGRLDENDEEPSYLGATLTYFDHRIADAHSFSEEVQKNLGLVAAKPYADALSVYYQDEEAEFDAYKQDVFSN